MDQLSKTTRQLANEAFALWVRLNAQAFAEENAGKPEPKPEYYHISEVPKLTDAQVEEAFALLISGKSFNHYLGGKIEFNRIDGDEIVLTRWTESYGKSTVRRSISYVKDIDLKGHFWSVKGVSYAMFKSSDWE